MKIFNFKRANLDYENTNSYQTLMIAANTKNEAIAYLANYNGLIFEEWIFDYENNKIIGTSKIPHIVHTVFH